MQGRGKQAKQCLMSSPVIVIKYFKKLWKTKIRWMTNERTYFSTHQEAVWKVVQVRTTEDILFSAHLQGDP